MDSTVIFVEDVDIACPAGVGLFPVEDRGAVTSLDFKEAFVKAAGAANLGQSEAISVESLCLELAEAMRSGVFAEVPSVMSHICLAEGVNSVERLSAVERDCCT